MKLFEFQEITLKNIKYSLQYNSIVIFHGDEGTGKSTTISNIDRVHINGNEGEILRCQGSIKNKFNDFGSIQKSLLIEFNKRNDDKSTRNSVIKDIGTAVGIENIISNFLSKDDEKDFKNMFSYVIKKSEKKPLIFVFDGLSFLDYKSYLFLHSLLIYTNENRLGNIRIVLVIDSEEDEYSFLKQLNPVSLVHEKIEYPTFQDLESFVNPSLMEIGKYVPLKVLIEIGDQIKDIQTYLNNQLDKFVPNVSLAQIIILSMSIFEDQMIFPDIILFTNNFDDYETFRILNTLVDIHLVEKESDEFDDFYKISKVYRDSILTQIPSYLLVNKLQIYVKHLENNLEFDYFRKFLIYKKINSNENAYINAISAYCSYARDYFIYSGEEIMTVVSFLKESFYSSLFDIIEQGYSYYRKEKYKECNILLTAFLHDNRFIVGNDIRFYSYSPEFIIEMVYLNALSSLRVEDFPPEELFIQKDVLYRCIEYAQNEELKLRIRETILLIEIEVAKENSSYYLNSFFSICSAYKNKIRQSSIRSLMYWEIRYAIQLLRINSISDVPDKLTLINEGYDIVKKHQVYFPKIYLRAACNYACDILWRGKYIESYNILKDAYNYINENGIDKQWGIITQMYTFSALYAQKEDSNRLLVKYKDNVWDNIDVRSRMHEQYLCKSNYAILLASNNYYAEAHEIIKEALNRCPQNKIYERYIMTTNLGVLEYVLGNVADAIRYENQCLTWLDQQRIPIFSKSFLYKRNMLLLNVYNSGQKIDQMVFPLETTQVLSTGYNSDQYTRPMLFSDINYWAN